jgi:hypothetical protein
LPEKGLAYVVTPEGAVGVGDPKSGRPCEDLEQPGGDV